MEVLHKYGSEAQKKQWLEPLLAGEIRSCFGMTEPAVASSDATNICTSATLEGDEWVINGEKHWTSGAGDPRCKVMICMVKTDPEAPKHLQQSQILVPMDTPGVNIVRSLKVFNMLDAPHGHMRVKLENVRVPKDNIIPGLAAASKSHRAVSGLAGFTIACVPSARQKKRLSCSASARPSGKRLVAPFINSAATSTLLRMHA